MPLLRSVTEIIAFGVIVLGAGLVCPQDYPNKPIRIVTVAAGGGGDFTARIIAQGISRPLGQPVIVDNRASGAAAGEAASKAPPDGYTLMVTGASLWVYPLLRKAPYDAVNDFAPISLIERSVFILAVHPSVPVKSVKELIALAKAHPGQLNYSSAAVGGSGHLAGELFKSMAGIDVVHIPYSGTAPAITALISGEVQWTIFDVGVVMPQVKSGKLRALAVTSATPSTLVPSLPPVAATVPGYESIGVTGIWAPTKTPGTIISRLNQEIVRVVNRPDVKEKFLNGGVEPVGSSAEQFATIIKSEIAKMVKVIKDSGIRVQ